MKRALLVIALLGAAAAAIVPWRIGNAAAGIDFFQFWAGAELMPRVDDLYSEETRQANYAPFVEQAFARDRSNDLLVAARTRQEFDFFSTPFLYATFRLLPQQYDRALFVYRVLSLAALIGGVLLFARASRLSWLWTAIVLTFTLTLYEAVKSEVRVVNVNFIQLFAIGLGAWLAASREKWRSIAAGFVLALVTMWKPNVALVLPLLLAYRWRARGKILRFAQDDTLIGAAAGAVFALLVSGPLDNWLEWLTHVRGLAEVRPLSLGNVAPVLPLVHKFGSPAAFVVAAILIALTVAALIRRKNESDATPLVIAVALLIYLLSSTLVWLHYLVLALPAGIVLLREKPWLGGLALTLVGLDVWLLLGVKFQATQALVLWLGLALLFAGSLWRLGSRAVR